MEYQNRIDLSELKQAADAIRNEVSKVLVGQHQMVDQFLVAILTQGHLLIEGVPGVAKTLAAKLVAKTLSLDFSRIQFTPDLMPSDVLGTQIFNQLKSQFEFKQGPIFSNIVLIDEINRAPAKTQSALFEVMEERQITNDRTTYQMDLPFLVFATQNPIEQEGTYRLPEAQLDRFLFKIVVDYPNAEQEFEILQKFHGHKKIADLSQIKAVVSKAQLLAFQAQLADIQIEESLLRYISQIVHQTRNHKSLYLGASPRASIAIMQSSKAMAALSGRDFVIPEDIKEVLNPVLNHRILLSAEKEMEGTRPADVIAQIIHDTEIPR
jgi:MoxR-like ATPase